MTYIKYIVPAITSFLFCLHTLSGQEKPDTAHLSLLFIGDVMGHDSQIAAAFNDTSKTYDYSDSFRFIKSRIESADIAIANLEVTLAGRPYKGYPEFSSPDALACELKNSGVDILVTANNHSCDKRGSGIERTINTLDSLGIPHTGTFKDSLDQTKNNPLFIQKNGFSLAILNYTYGTNGIPIPKNKIVNLIDTVRIKSDIDLAKSKNPDLIIAFLHWGTEYMTTADKNQKRVAEFLKNQGIKLIIGSHPHVVQPMEFDTISNQLVVYSLGNFISGQRTAPRDGGVIVKVNIEKKDNEIQISNTSYELTYVHYPFIKGKRRFMVVPVKDIENNIISNAPGNQGWGRLHNYAADARNILKANKNVSESK